VDGGAEDRMAVDMRLGRFLGVGLRAHGLRRRTILLEFEMEEVGRREIRARASGGVLAWLVGT